MLAELPPYILGPEGGGGVAPVPCPAEKMIDLEALIEAVPDFPSEGILFRDITPLLADATALHSTIQRMADPLRDQRIDHVAGIESRGFIFATPISLALDAGFVPVRKLGKLPRKTVGRSYALEYGENHLEIHADAIQPGDRVLLVDDVLATGGTARAAAELIEELGGEVVAISFLLEIVPLKGRDALGNRPVHTLLKY